MPAVYRPYPYIAPKPLQVEIFTGGATHYQLSLSYTGEIRYRDRK
jgi:hypothetical protein